jgi:large subunit ribosomal protein L25
VSDTKVHLVAQPRSDFGKGASRRLRRAGFVPAVIYGPKTELRHVALSSHDLTQALKKPRVVFAIAVEGKEYTVAPRDVQRDVVRQVLEHVDLVVIDQAEVTARAAAAEAIEAAEAAAEEAGVDPSAAIEAINEAIAAGEDPEAAAKAALAESVTAAEHQVEAQAHADAVEAAEAADEAADEAAKA